MIYIICKIKNKKKTIFARDML